MHKETRRFRDLTAPIVSLSAPQVYNVETAFAMGQPNDQPACRFPRQTSHPKNHIIGPRLSVPDYRNWDISDP